MKNKFLSFVFISSCALFISADCVHGYDPIIADEKESIKGCSDRFYATDQNMIDLCTQDAKNDADRKIGNLAQQCGLGGYAATPLNN